MGNGCSNEESMPFNEEIFKHQLRQKEKNYQETYSEMRDEYDDAFIVTIVDPYNPKNLDN